MSDNRVQQVVDVSRYAKITSPIPLLALFGGITELMIILTLAFHIDPQYQKYILFGAIGLPVGWLVVIFILIAKYHSNLYAPTEFGKPELFLETIPVAGKGTLGNPSDFGPFKLSDYGLDPSDIRTIESAQLRWDEFISHISAEDLLTLYAWYNEKNKHHLALQTSALAIAKGSAASKNYSFASASLRKLGRYTEAKAFASLALDQDENNIDAIYNLALIYKAMGNTERATLYAKDVLSRGTDYHKGRIQQVFPSLQS